MQVRACLFELSACLLELRTEASGFGVAFGFDLGQARAQAEDGGEVFFGRLGAQLFFGTQRRFELTQAIGFTP